MLAMHLPQKVRLSSSRGSLIKSRRLVSRARGLLSRNLCQRGAVYASPAHGVALVVDTRSPCPRAICLLVRREFSENSSPRLYMLSLDTVNIWGNLWRFMFLEVCLLLCVVGGASRAVARRRSAHEGLVAFARCSAPPVMVLLLPPLQLPDDWQFSDTNSKAHVLLQAHFSRTPLATDLRADQKVTSRANMVRVP